MPTHLVTLGDHIRKKRIENNKAQRDVAKIIGVSEDAITYWENNRSQPQIHFYPAIIAFLGYYPFDLETTSIAEKLKYVRFNKGYSYEQFGELFAVNASTVRGWELAINTPTKQHLQQVTSLFNDHFPF